MILHAKRGATQEQIAARSGHKDLRIAHYYARGANKKRILSPRAEVLAHPDIVDRLHARLVETLTAEATAAADTARRCRC